MENGSGEPEMQLKVLNDIKAGTVLEVLSHCKITTARGEADVLTVVSTLKVGIGNKTRRITFELMVPDRFNAQCNTVPCLVYYDGKKPTKKGQECHDVRFYRVDDLTKGDIDDDVEDTVETQRINDEEETRLAAAAVVSTSFTLCAQCLETGHCFTNCSLY